MKISSNLSTQSLLVFLTTWYYPGRERDYPFSIELYISVHEILDHAFHGADVNVNSRRLCSKLRHAFLHGVMWRMFKQPHLYRLLLDVEEGKVVRMLIKSHFEIATNTLSASVVNAEVVGCLHLRQFFTRILDFH